MAVFKRSRVTHVHLASTNVCVEESCQKVCMYLYYLLFYLSAPPLVSKYRGLSSHSILAPPVVPKSRT